MWYCEDNITLNVWVQLGTRKQLWPALKIPIEKLFCTQHSNLSVGLLNLQMIKVN